MGRIVRVVLAGMASLAAFAASKIAPDMPSSTATGMADIIVQYKSHPSVARLNQMRLAGRLKRQFHAIPAVHMNVPVSRVAELAADPAVAYISPNRATSNFLDITTQ